MPTIEPYRWFLTNSGAEANGAEVVNVTLGPDVLRHLLETLRPEAGQALGLAGHSTAVMAARQYLVTGLLHQLEALLLSANILEGWFHARRGLFHFLTTESAAGELHLVTSPAQVVRLGVTLGTEVLSTSIAPDSVVGHVLRSLRCQRVALVVLHSRLNLTWLHEHDVAAGAGNHVWILFDDVHHLVLVDLLLHLFSQVFVQLPRLDVGIASGTLDGQVV